MNDVGIIFASIGTLILLAGIAGSVWAVIRTSAQEATIKRLRDENEDYLRRLNYLEPRVEVLESRNEILEQLHNPAKAIAEVATQVAQLLALEMQNHGETIDLMKEETKRVETILNKIDRHLQERPV